MQPINEIELSGEAKAALHKMIHQSVGVEPKDIAELTGDSHKTILNYANRNMENHLPSLKKFEAILMYTQNPALLKVWAHKLGYILVCNKQACETKEHQVSVVEQLLPINVDTGNLNQTIHNILADGVITPCEMNEAMEVIDQMSANLHGLRKAIEKECNRYVKQIGKEKA